MKKQKERKEERKKEHHQTGEEKQYPYYWSYSYKRSEAQFCHIDLGRRYPNGIPTVTSSYPWLHTWRHT